MTDLLLIPLDDTVVFPTMDVTLPIDVDGEQQVLLVPRHEGEYAQVGTIARVVESMRSPGGGRGAVLTLEGPGAAVHRSVVLTLFRGDPEAAERI